MQNCAHFIAIDPSKKPKTTPKKNQNAARLQCQTCFNSFKTYEGLRDHIAEFQLEIQQLTQRLLEAHAHLTRHREPVRDFPNDDYKDGDDDSDTDIEDEEDSDYESDGMETEDRRQNNSGDYGEDKSSDRTTLSSMRCPFPKCRRKEHFNGKLALERHYESHVSCHDICVYCGLHLKDVRKFMRHACSPRQKDLDEAKELYRKERCRQLSKLSRKKLASDKARDRQISKRTGERADGTAVTNTSRSRKEDLTQGTDAAFMMSKNSYGFTIPNEPMNSLTNLSNMTFPSSILPHAQMGPAYSAFGARADPSYAPIFNDITITPYYDLAQDTYPLPSNQHNVGYSAIP